MDSNFQIDYEVKKEAKYDLVSQFIGILSALLPVLAILGVNLEWFNQDFIDSLGVLLSAIIFFVINAYAVYKNHFSSKKAQKQNEVLKTRGLK